MFVKIYVEKNRYHQDDENMRLPYTLTESDDLINNGIFHF